MPIATTIPVVPPVPGDVLRATTLIVALLPTAGGSQVNIRMKSTSLNRTIQKLQRRVPDTDGALIPDYTDIINKDQVIRGRVDEFGSSFVTTFINGTQLACTAKVWIKSTRDAADTAFLVSNEFSALAYFDGELPLNAESLSEAQFTIEISGAFTMSRAVSTL